MTELAFDGLLIQVLILDAPFCGLQTPVSETIFDWNFFPKRFQLENMLFELAGVRDCDLSELIILDNKVFELVSFKLEDGLMKVGCVTTTVSFKVVLVDSLIDLFPFVIKEEVLSA